MVSASSMSSDDNVLFTVYAGSDGKSNGYQSVTRIGSLVFTHVNYSLTTDNKVQLNNEVAEPWQTFQKNTVLRCYQLFNKLTTPRTGKHCILQTDVFVSGYYGIGLLHPGAVDTQVVATDVHWYFIAVLPSHNVFLCLQVNPTDTWRCRYVWLAHTFDGGRPTLPPNHPEEIAQGLLSEVTNLKDMMRLAIQGGRNDILRADAMGADTFGLRSTYTRDRLAYDRLTQLAHYMSQVLPAGCTQGFPAGRSLSVWPDNSYNCEKINTLQKWREYPKIDDHSVVSINSVQEDHIA